MNRLISIAFGFSIGYLIQFYDQKRLRNAVQELEKQKNDLKSQLESENIDIEDEVTEETSEESTQGAENIEELTKELAALSLKLESALAENQALKVMLDNQLASAQIDTGNSLDTNDTENTFSENLPPSVNPEQTPTVTPKVDNLKLIEGIGPEIEKLLNSAGLLLFSDVANASSGYLKEILLRGGDRFRIHNPDSWPEQAALARDGKMEELKALQDRLLGGREP